MSWKRGKNLLGMEEERSGKWVCSIGRTRIDRGEEIPQRQSGRNDAEVLLLLVDGAVAVGEVDIVDVGGGATRSGNTVGDRIGAGYAGDQEGTAPFGVNWARHSRRQPHPHIDAGLVSERTQKGKSSKAKFPTKREIFEIQRDIEKIIERERWTCPRRCSIVRKNGNSLE